MTPCFSQGFQALSYGKLMAKLGTTQYLLKPKRWSRTWTQTNLGRLQRSQHVRSRNVFILYGGPQLSREKQITHAKNKFSHSKSKFTHGKSNIRSRQKQIAHGTEQIAHGKSRSTQNAIFVIVGVSGLFSKCCYSSQLLRSLIHSPCFPLTLASRVRLELLLISHISKCKSEHAHILWFHFHGYISWDSSGLCQCYTELTTKACRNQKFFGVKLPIRYKQTRLNWCTPHGKNMALGVSVYKSYERSKSLVDTCSGSLA